jgi:hemoglobin-like flavoprotein
MFGVMTPDRIRLLQRSLALIEPMITEIGQSFYKKLFKIAPELQAMFDFGGERRQEKLQRTFNEFLKLQIHSHLTLPVTDSITSEVSVPGLHALAESHNRYGVRPEHFAAMKEALFWSFRLHLGDAFDRETASVWSEAYDMIAGSMVRVMKHEARPPALREARTGAGERGPVTLEMLFRE